MWEYKWECVLVLVCVSVCVDWTQNVYEHFSWPLSVVLCGPRPPIINIIHIYDADQRAPAWVGVGVRHRAVARASVTVASTMCTPFHLSAVSLPCLFISPRARPLRSKPPPFLAMGQTKPRRVASGACASLLLSMICFWAHKMQANWIFSDAGSPSSLVCFFFGEHVTYA